RRLVAYVCAPPGRPAPEPDALRRALARRLPAYMRPAHLLVLDALPLTPGGKLDRNALPPPGPAARRAPPVAPRTEVERALAAVWAQALGLPEVGVEDDFFELGGDSLLSMRLVSLGAQAGLTFTPKQVFQNPTVASLAAALGGERAGRGADQGPLEGPLPLTPNQHLSFEHDDPDRHIWNVSTLLALDARPDPAALAEAWRHVVSHHDALRVRSTPGPEGWRQHIAPPDETPAFARVDLAPLPDAELAAAIEAEASALQQSLDLTRGPLARLTYFDLGPGRGARLFALVHHTVCDGLSIEIVLEDLLTAFLQLSRGEPVRLPPKTTSLRALAERLVELARSGPVRAQAAHWLAEERRAVAPLPVDLPGGRNTGATARELDTALDAGETRALLALVSTADDVHVNDLLLAGLSGALAAFTGRRHALVEIEDHGRSIDGLDLSRTVGWLNYLYPVLLDAGEAATPRERLRLARAALRSVPDRGLGYGLLTYLVDDEALRAQVRALPRAQVLFNYRGNFDLRGSLLIDRAPAALGLRPAAEPTGLPHSLTTVRQHLFMVNAEVFGGRLRVQWTYSRDLYRPATVEALAGAYLAELRALAADP
ncbi:MAG TPA: condensation domain-containing protein, partial [Polyangiaceae bacterium]|nr:condensation domain-containing protein [Polyangiaceae bacterium]